MIVNPRRPISLRTATSLGDLQPVPGTGGSSKDTGKSAETMNTELAVLRDAQPMLTSCGRCSSTHVGLTGDGRAWFRAHLAAKHPEVKPRRRRSSGLGAWSRGNKEEKAEAMVEVEARKAMLA